MIENTIQVEGGLGDASPSQVMAGATFTSETGFKQSGTFEPIAKNIGYDNTSSGLQAETTQDAIDEHIANTKAELADTVPYNLIQFPYFDGSHTDNGIEWVVNEDGIVMANGNATGDSEFTVRRRLSDNTPFVLPAGTYTVSGCPVNGRDTTYVLSVIKTSESTGGAELITREYGSGATFTLEKETIIGVNFYIKKGQTADNLTLKPMLVKGSETKPYHRGFKSVYELDKSVHEMKKSVVDHLLSTSQDLPLSANQGRMLNEKVDSVNEKLADCWISFTDADGNPTTEPYIHWNEEE